MTVPKWANTVTPFSKALAMTLFILFIVLAFFFGRYYERTIEFQFESGVLGVVFAQSLDYGRADIDQSGEVDLNDYSILVSMYGAISDENGHFSPPNTNPTSSDDQNESSSSELSSLVIDDIQFIQYAQVVGSEDTIDPNNTYAISVNFQSTNNISELRDYEDFRVQKSIEPGVWHDAQTHAIHVKKLGTYRISIHDDIYHPSGDRFADHVDNVRLDEPTPIKIRVYSLSDPSIFNEKEFTIGKNISKPGLFTYGIAVYSSTSGGNALDRKDIANANVVMTSTTQNGLSYSFDTGSAGNGIQYDVEPGIYTIQASYGNVTSNPKTVTVGEGEYSSTSVIIPILPAQVDIVPGTFYGRIIENYTEFGESPVVGTTVSLYEAEKPDAPGGGVDWTIRNPIRLVATTQSDSEGFYTFENVPGDKYYYVDYDPPAGLKFIYGRDSELRTFNLYTAGTAHETTILDPIR